MLAQEGGQCWVKKEKFQPMLDFIKETWVYQELREEALQEGIEQGRESGLAQGLEQGREQEMERTILRFVELRFPMLLNLAQQQIEHKMSLEQLRLIIDKLYLSTIVDDARATLLSSTRAPKSR
jgi:flagellar biosynthesis/type III secretory pathway protein FliH